MSNEVSGYHWGLRSRRCGGLSIRRIHDIATRPNVAEPLVLQGCLIDVDPSLFITERGVAYEIWGALRWTHVDHIEGFFALAIRARKRRYFLSTVNACQRRLEIQLHAVSVHVLHQSWHIVSHTEESGGRGAELNVDRLQTPPPTPMIRRKVKGFLWRTRAFYRHWRLGE